MPQPCKICARSDREAIETKIAAGWSRRRVAEAFDGLSESAVQRHRAEHIPRSEGKTPGDGRRRDLAETVVGAARTARGSSWTAQDEAEGHALVEIAGLADRRPNSVMAQHELRIALADFRRLHERSVEWDEYEEVTAALSADDPCRHSYNPKKAAESQLKLLAFSEPTTAKGEP